VSESSSVTARSLLLGFSMAYSTRSQSSNVRWVWCWREVISIRCRTKWGQCASLSRAEKSSLTIIALNLIDQHERRLTHSGSWLQLVLPRALAAGKRSGIETAKAPRAGLAGLAGGDACGAGQGVSRGRADTRQGGSRPTSRPKRARSTTCKDGQTPPPLSFFQV
jgi:hypothetical protein